MLEKAKQEVTYCEEMLRLVGKLEESPPDHTQVIGNLIDQVDRLNLEVTELRNSSRMRENIVRARAGGSRRATIESRVSAVLDILRTNRRQFDVNELQELLGLDHVQTISAMREAVRTTGQIRMSQGKRRKLFVSYVGGSEPEGIRV